MVNQQDRGGNNLHLAAVPTATAEARQRHTVARTLAALPRSAALPRRGTRMPRPACGLRAPRGGSALHEPLELVGGLEQRRVRLAEGEAHEVGGEALVLRR